MRKAEMVQRVAEALGGPNVQAEAAVEAILATITEALRQGEPVILRRFGTWQVRAKRARVGRNPKTGAVAAIPARRVVRFVVSQTLKQAVAGSLPRGLSRQPELWHNEAEVRPMDHQRSHSWTPMWYLPSRYLPYGRRTFAVAFCAHRCHDTAWQCTVVGSTDDMMAESVYGDSRRVISRYLALDAIDSGERRHGCAGGPGQCDRVSGGGSALESAVCADTARRPVLATSDDAVCAGTVQGYVLL